MNADMFVDLDALHDAIEADIQAQFPGLQTVEFYRTDERRSLTVPAVLLDLTEFEAQPESDPGTEQLSVVARFEAEIIMGFRTPNVKREIRNFAAAFAAWMRLRRFTRENVRTGPAQVIGCYPDDFNPELDQYEVWRVEWLQELHLGDTVWTNEGVVPTRIMVGYSPDVGTGNEAEYTEIALPPAAPGECDKP